MAETASPAAPTASRSAFARALEVMRRPHFSPYKLFIRRDLRLAVGLNPKVGSTAFRQIIVEGLTLIGARPRLGPWWPLNRTRRFTTAPLGEMIHALAHPADYAFHCFVRNPYTRVISAWNDKFVRGFNSPTYARSMVKLVPRVRAFADARGLPGGTAELQAPVPFPTFLAYVESQPEGGRNQHWDTQRSVLLADRIPYRHIHRMETDFAAGMVAITQPLGIPSDWVEQKAARPANASGALQQPVLDAALAARVQHLYAADFKRFGYDPNSWHGL